MSKITVDKIKVAESHLNGAIQLLFSGNAIAADTLANAADQIIHDIQVNQSPDKSRFTRSMRGEFLSRVKNEFQNEARKTLNRSYNFFKHADRDASETLEYETSAVDLLIFFAIIGFSHLTGKCTEAMGRYQTWFMMMYPDLLKDEVEVKVSLTGPDNIIPGWPREKQLMLGKIILEADSSGFEDVATKIKSEIINRLL